MKMILTHAALEDLRSIRKYTFETWGSQQEELYLGRIWERFETIRAAPTRYRQRHDLFAGCRIAAEGSHVILFRCAAESVQAPPVNDYLCIEDFCCDREPKRSGVGRPVCSSILPAICDSHANDKPMKSESPPAGPSFHPTLSAGLETRVPSVAARLRQGYEGQAGSDPLAA